MGAGNIPVRHPITFYDDEQLTIASSAGAYSYAFAEDSTTFNVETINLPQGAIDLAMLDYAPLYRDMLPGGLRFTFNGATYFDRGDGRIYRNLDHLTGVAVDSGSVNYQGGAVSIEEYAAGTPALNIQGLAVSEGIHTGSWVAFRTEGAPLAPGSLFVQATALDGSTITATANNDGTIVADELDGYVDVQTGVCGLNFGHLVGEDWIDKPVDLSSIRYNAVITNYVPLDPTILTLDPTRLPIDGRVPIFRPGQIVIIHHTDSEQLDAPLSAGQTVQLSRAPLSKIWLHDENGVVIPDALWSGDLTLGQITFADPLDLSAYQQPLVATSRAEQMRLCTETQINGQIKLLSAITANFPADDTYVSSVMLFGDLQSRVEHLFTQKTWGNVWSNSRIGDDSVGKYNDVVYPIEINNRTAITERWAIVFTSSTQFNVVGEFSGVIATGNTSTDCAPENPYYPGESYFTIRADGWGAGWVSNNVLRFNTVGAYAPVWIIRSTQAGDAVATQDEGGIEFRGDAD